MNNAVGQGLPSFSVPAPIAGTLPLLLEYRLGYTQAQEAATGGSSRAVGKSFEGHMTDDRPTEGAQTHAKKLFQDVVETAPIRVNRDVSRRGDSAPMKALDC